MNQSITSDFLFKELHNKQMLFSALADKINVGEPTYSNEEITSFYEQCKKLNNFIYELDGLSHKLAMVVDKPPKKSLIQELKDEEIKLAEIRSELGNTTLSNDEIAHYVTKSDEINRKIICIKDQIQKIFESLN